MKLLQDSAGTSLATKDIKVLKEAASRKNEVSVDCESHACFSKAVGQEARWHGGCFCHDWIWTQDISEAQKAKLFSEATHGRQRECVWWGTSSPPAAAAAISDVEQIQQAMAVATIHRHVELAAHHRNHRFFVVVNPSIEKRFNLIHDKASTSQAVVREVFLTGAGRTDGTFSFASNDSAQAIDHRGM